MWIRSRAMWLENSSECARSTIRWWNSTLTAEYSLIGESVSEASLPGRKAGNRSSRSSSSASAARSAASRAAMPSSAAEARITSMISALVLRTT